MSIMARNRILPTASRTSLVRPKGTSQSPQSCIAALCLLLRRLAEMLVVVEEVSLVDTLDDVVCEKSTTCTGRFESDPVVSISISDRMILTSSYPNQLQEEEDDSCADTALSVEEQSKLTCDPFELVIPGGQLMTSFSQRGPIGRDMSSCAVVWSIGAKLLMELLLFIMKEKENCETKTAKWRIVRR